MVCRALTSVLVTVHLMVGCCAHHAHGRESDVLTSANDSHLHSTSDGRDCPDSRSSHGPQDCKGEKCSFVLSADTVVSKPALYVPSLPGAVLRASICDSASCEERVRIGWLLLPVRLHLAHQVLLI